MLFTNFMQSIFILHEILRLWLEAFIPSTNISFLLGKISSLNVSFIQRSENWWVCSWERDNLRSTSLLGEFPFLLGFLHQIKVKVTFLMAVPFSVTVFSMTVLLLQIQAMQTSSKLCSSLRDSLTASVTSPAAVRNLEPKFWKQTKGYLLKPWVALSISIHFQYTPLMIKAYFKLLECNWNLNEIPGSVFGATAKYFEKKQRWNWVNFSSL